jgi:hypothetical protein
MLFRNSICTAKKKCFSITKTIWSMVFKEIVAVYSKNHTKPVNTFSGREAELPIVKAGGTFNYNWAYKG